MYMYLREAAIAFSEDYYYLRVATIWGVTSNGIVVLSFSSTCTCMSLQHNVTVQGVTVQAVTEPIDIARLLNIGESKCMIFIINSHSCMYMCNIDCPNTVIILHLHV